MAMLPEITVKGGDPGIRTGTTHDRMSGAGLQAL
jgi:hypothetical protein